MKYEGSNLRAKWESKVNPGTAGVTAAYFKIWQENRCIQIPHFKKGGHKTILEFSPKYDIS